MQSPIRSDSRSSTRQTLLVAIYFMNKLLGQNWLINPKIHQEIIKAGEIGENDTVLEVGPGTGLLTTPLAQTGAQIIAVEKDSRLAAELNHRFGDYKNVRIIQGDILKFDPKNYKLQAGSYKVIGNLPYYLTSHLIRSLLEDWRKPQLAVFMVQKEVAQRMIAKPPAMNMLGLAVQWYAQAEIITVVAKGNFRPVPKVDSAIIKIVPQPLSAEKSQLTPFLFKIARAGFAGKRKQLANSLANGLSIPKADLEQVFQKTNLDGRRRPETLSIPEWLKLSSALSSLLPAD